MKMRPFSAILAALFVLSVAAAPVVGSTGQFIDLASLSAGRGSILALIVIAFLAYVAMGHSHVRVRRK